MATSKEAELSSEDKPEVLDNKKERAKELLKIAKIRSLDDQISRVKRINDELQQSLNETTSEYRERIADCEIKELKAERNRIAATTTEERNKLVLKHETRLKDNKPIKKTKFEVTLFKKQKINERIRVTYIIENSSVSCKMEKINKKVTTIKKEPNDNAEAPTKQQTSEEPRQMSSIDTTDRSLSIIISDQSIDKTIDELDKENSPGTEGRKQNRRKIRRAMTETESEDEENSLTDRMKTKRSSEDRGKQSAKRIKLIKDANRSRIAKTNIKFQPREPPGAKSKPKLMTQ